MIKFIINVFNWPNSIVILSFGFLFSIPICLATAQENEAYFQKPDLFIVGIGVSEYKNYPDKNLKFADKDVIDLVERYSNASLFNKIHHFLITNKHVCRDSVLAIRNKLMRTTIEDHVIVIYSGHGLIENNFDFYFSTYPILLNKLDSTAIRFEELEHLLDGIPARKKLLLIDACYSGQIDKDKVNQIIKQPMPNSPIHFNKLPKDFYPVAKSGNDQNIFELMRALFVDMNRRTGSTILSSSSSVEVSYEDGNLKNGLFSYAILEALESNSKADYNKDQKVYLSELIRYVRETVLKLSKGVQIPNVREDNLEFDYQIW